MNNSNIEGKSVCINLYYKDEIVGKRVFTPEILESLDGNILNNCINDSTCNDTFDYHLPLGVKLEDWDKFMDTKERDICNLGQALLACALSVEMPIFKCDNKVSIYISCLDDEHLEAIAQMNQDHPMYNYFYNDILNWLKYNAYMESLWNGRYHNCFGGLSSWDDFDLLNRWIKLLKIIYMRPRTNQILVELYNIKNIKDYNPIYLEGIVIEIGSNSLLWDSYAGKLTLDCTFGIPIEIGTKIMFKDNHDIRKIINEGKTYAIL